jgi:hypothetical protein
MAMPLIPFTLAWLIGIWLASRIVLPTLALGAATLVAIVGIILTWRAPRPRWTFILALAAMNLTRVARWLAKEPLARARPSAFVRLQVAAA